MSINYDRNAKVYDARHGGEIAPHIAQGVMMLAGLKAGDLLLDMASGTGRGCLAFARQGLSVTATDISAQMLEQLMIKSTGLSLQTQVVGAAGLDFEEASFDAVSLSRALYLIADWREGLLQMRRVLRPGGVFITPARARKQRWKPNYSPSDLRRTAPWKQGRVFRSRRVNL